ncbi:hypothetical protein FQZ97_1216190 [compost metagenome]
MIFACVASLMTSTARWPGLPLPAELNVRPRVLPAATMSARVLKPVDGFTPTSRPDDAITTSGLRSLRLNGMFEYRCGLTVKVVSMPNSTV